MSEKLRILSVGDLLLSGRYDELVRNGGSAAVFSMIQDKLSCADIVVGNLECPLTDRGEPQKDKLCLRGEPKYAKHLADAGFDLVSLANNHLSDFGHIGLRDTISHLEKAGVSSTGAGSTLDVATKPVVIRRKNLKIGFLGYCHPSTMAPIFAGKSKWGVAELAEPQVLEAIRQHRSKLDHLILLLHWGLEYSPIPTPDQRQFAHRAIDAGVSVILGHHSHMIQGIEHYKGSVIAYSLGNCTDSAVDWQGPTRHFRCDITDVDRMGMALGIEISRNGVHGSVPIPLWLNDEGQPTAATGETQRKILDDIDSRSAQIVGGDLERYWQEKLVDKRVMGPLIYWWQRGSLLEKVKAFRPGQLKTLYLLAETWLRIKISRSNAKWGLFNARNDTRPMPYAGDSSQEDESRKPNQ